MASGAMQKLSLSSASACLVLSLGACNLGDQRIADDASACSAVLDPAVQVSVSAAVTGSNLGADSVGEIHDVIDLDADYVDALMVYTVDAGEVIDLAAGLERAGTYDVRVRHAGYAEWSDTAVVVADGTCGPTTVAVDAQLVVNPVVVQDSGDPDVTETDSLITVASCDPAPLGWSGRLEADVVVLERVNSGDCLTSTDYDEIRIWDAPGLGPQLAAHRIFRLTDSVSTTDPNQTYVRGSDWMAGGTIDVDSYDEAGVVSGRLDGVDGDGDTVELIFWVDLNR